MIMKTTMIFKKLFLVALATMALGMDSAFAGNIGDTVNVTYYFPDSASPYQDLGTQVISGAGNTFNFAGYFDVVVTDNQIFAQNFAFTSMWSPASFSGFVVTDLTQNFTSPYTVDVGTTMSGLTNANIMSSGNSVSVNWQGLSFDQSTVVELTAGGAAVPEPATVALFGFGLIAVAASRRKSAKNKGV
jgi:hypothetical protein